MRELGFFGFGVTLPFRSLSLSLGSSSGRYLGRFGISLFE